jgi:hypothetical protein
MRARFACGAFGLRIAAVRDGAGSALEINDMAS